MSDAQKLINEVLRRHGLRCATHPECRTDTLAAEIDKALGGLRVESALRVTVNQTDRRIVLTDPTDISAARRFATEENNTLADVSRWASGWSEVQS